MDGFFEKYGRVIVVAIAICFVILLLTPMRGAIGTSVDGVAKDFSGTVDKSLATVKMPEVYPTGTVINVDGYELIIIKHQKDNRFLVITGKTIRNMQWQPNQDENGNDEIGAFYETDVNVTRKDGCYSNTYENSYIDNYLENEWYLNLPNNLKNAIVKTNIQQASYERIGEPNDKQKFLTKNTTPKSPTGTRDWFYNEGTALEEKWVRADLALLPKNEKGVHPFTNWKEHNTDYGNNEYNKISRHVFLPSVMEINDLVDLNNGNDTNNFLKGTNNDLLHIWTRDSNYNSYDNAMILSKYYHSIVGHNITPTFINTRPCFVVDLSKADYSVEGYVNYGRQGSKETLLPFFLSNQIFAHQHVINEVMTADCACEGLDV